MWINWNYLKNSDVRFNVENRISWDGEFLVDIGMKGFKITRVSDVWGVFRIYETSITGSGKFKTDGEREFQRIRKKILSVTGLSKSLITLYAFFRPFNSLNRRILNYYRSYSLRKYF